MFKVKGRSIDGTLYALRSGWTDDIDGADKFTLVNAHERVAKQRAINAETEPDGIIGRLEIINA